MAPSSPEALKILRCFEKSHVAQICGFKSLNTYENLGCAKPSFDGSQRDLAPKGPGPWGNHILTLDMNASNGIIWGKNAEEVNPSGSQSPFLFQRCLKYCTQPCHAAALPPQGTGCPPWCPDLGDIRLASQGTAPRGFAFGLKRDRAVKMHFAEGAGGCLFSVCIVIY